MKSSALPVSNRSLPLAVPARYAACALAVLLPAYAGAQSSTRPTTPSPGATPAASTQTAAPPAADSPQAAPQAIDASQSPQKPSAVIAPAIDNLGQVVSKIQLEKWKGSVRDETDDNLRSVERDISTTLPPLVMAADAQPTSLVLALPVLQNLNALCAVMVRVSVTARTAAPTPQADSIANALTIVESARNALQQQVLGLAAAQQTQLAALQANVTALTAKLNAPPPPPPAAAPATKKRTTRRAAKPTQ